MKRKYITAICITLSIFGMALIVHKPISAANLWENFFLRITTSQTMNASLPENQIQLASTKNEKVVSQNSENQLNNANATLPEFAKAELILSLLPTLDSAAAKMQAQGKDGRIWSNYLERHLGFAPQQIAIIRQVSTEFGAAVQPTHNRAKQIIAERRAARSNGQRATPAPPELIALQQHRQSLAVRYGTRLRTLLGNAPFQQLEQLFQRNNDPELEALTPTVHEEIKQQWQNVPANLSQNFTSTPEGEQQ